MKFSFSLILFGFFLAKSKFSNATSKHMICKTVDDVFNEENDINDDVPVISRRHQNGPPGKSGTKGERGDPGQLGVKGEPGMPGIVDYEKINDTIKNLISSIESSFTAKIESLEERLLSKIKETIVIKDDTITDTPGEPCNGFLHNDHCFWAEIHSSENFDYNEAVEICARNSGRPADITSAQQYDAVVENVRSNMPPTKTYVNFWSALTMNPSSKQVQLSNGIQAPYLKYYPDFPTSSSPDTKIAIGIQKDSASTQQGMFNWSPNKSLMGVVCQK